MGNKWGIIYNGLDQQVLYSLHTLPFSPFDQFIEKQQRKMKKLQMLINMQIGSSVSVLNAEKSFNELFGHSQILANLKVQIQKKNNISMDQVKKQYQQLKRPKTCKQRREEYLKIEGVYTIPPDFYVQTQLTKVDFQQKRFISIITFSGQKVMSARPIKQHADLRINIGNFIDKNSGKKELFEIMDPERVNTIKQRIISHCIRKSGCQRCPNKIRFAQGEQKHACHQCSKKVKQYWTCQIQSWQIGRIRRDIEASIKNGYFTHIERQITWHQCCEPCVRIQKLMNLYGEMQKSKHRDYVYYGERRQAEIQRAVEEGRQQAVLQKIEEKYNDNVTQLKQKFCYDMSWKLPSSKPDIEDVSHQYA